MQENNFAITDNFLIAEFQKSSGEDALSQCVAADNERNNGSCATACKTIEKKKSTFVIYGLPSHRHFWTGGDGMKSKS